MKILHLHTYLNLTCGVTKTIFLVAKNLRVEHEHICYTLGGDAIRKFRKSNIEIIVGKVNQRGIFDTVITFFQLLSVIRKQNIEIVHSHHRYFDLLAFVISKFAKIRTVTSVQSKVYGKKRLSYKSEILIACSNSIKQHLVEYFKFDRRRIEVIHNFIDVSEIEDELPIQGLKDELGINSDLLVIGFVGRISIREKGVDLLLEAFNQVTEEYQNLCLLIIGDGEDKELVKNIISQNKLPVIFLEPKEKIYPYIKLMDIVVLPSRVEPFGIVAIEAGIMKKPIVTSDVGGLIEIVDDGINGLLFSRGNKQSLFEKLELLISNSKLRIEFGEKLYQKVSVNFTVHQSIPKYNKIYEKLVN